MENIIQATPVMLSIQNCCCILNVCSNTLTNDGKVTVEHIIFFCWQRTSPNTFSKNHSLGVTPVSNRNYSRMENMQLLQFEGKYDSIFCGMCCLTHVRYICKQFFTLNKKSNLR